MRKYVLRSTAKARAEYSTLFLAQQLLQFEFSYSYENSNHSNLNTVQSGMDGGQDFAVTGKRREKVGNEHSWAVIAMYTQSASVFLRSQNKHDGFFCCKQATIVASLHVTIYTAKVQEMSVRPKSDI